LQSAGLEAITEKQLILASQSLDLIIKISRCASKTLGHYLNVRQSSLLAPFDKIIEDYKNNQEQVHIKIIDSMVSRIIIHSKALSEMDWDLPNARDIEKENNISNSMYSLVNEIRNLHKLLQKYVNIEILCVIEN
jgi:hypothetical protein